MGDYSLTYSEANTAREAYEYFAKLIDEKGEIVTTRGEKTKEVLSSAVLIKNIRDRFIPIPNLDLPFIFQELFDIFNENQPRVNPDPLMLEKTMGDKKNKFYFGNENRQGNSRWSLLRLRDVLVNDKHSRKAIISYGSRRPKVHYPCLVYSHFIIRNDKLHLTVETRGTSISMAWPNDVILFSVIQEMMLGWLREYYPELKMGEFLYKTTSNHYFANDDGTPTWSQELLKMPYFDMTFDLNHKEWVQEMGVLYYYVDEYMKAKSVEDIDNGDITIWEDIEKSFIPRHTYFKTEFFYKWALVLYYHTKSKFTNEQFNYLDIWNSDVREVF